MAPGAGGAALGPMGGMSTPPPSAGPATELSLSLAHTHTHTHTHTHFLTHTHSLFLSQAHVGRDKSTSFKKAGTGGSGGGRRGTGTHGGYVRTPPECGTGAGCPPATSSSLPTCLCKGEGVSECVREGVTFVRESECV